MTRRKVAALLAASAVALVATALQSDSEPVTPTVRFTAAGDYATLANAQAVLSKVGTLAPDLHLALGDLSYDAPGSEQAWCDLVTARVGTGFPFELLSGNHEANGQNGHINNFSACLPNQLPGVVGTYGRQYYVDVPRVNPLVRYVMISPGLTFPEGAASYTPGSPRYQWTAAAIDGARAADIPWVVVGMHMPCLSVGEHICDSGPAITNLLVSKRVDLVLTGHEHMYARTKQLALQPGCTAISPDAYNPSCVVDSDADLTQGAGTVFDTVGTGGVTTVPVDTTQPDYPYFAVTNGTGNATYGVLQVSATASTLSAAFQRASGGTFADSFVITAGAPAPNQPPTAAFTASPAGLGVSFDATGSSDADGTVAGYAWDFGDGQTGSGATPNHAYAAPGTYAVRLTVTDDDGATAATTRSVTVSNATPPTVLGSDDFTRTLATGWGVADQGGTWTVKGSASVASVTGGKGLVRMAAGAGTGLFLSAVDSSDTDAQLSLSLDKVPTGGSTGSGQSLWVRRVATAGDYRATVRFLPNAGVRVGLYSANTSGVQTALTTEVPVPGLSYTAGTALAVRAQATGTSPTTVRAKVWKRGDPEPAGWTVSTADATPGLQQSGTVGVQSYLTGTATNAPISAAFDDIRVQRASTLP
jgi:PKD repeat protein